MRKILYTYNASQRSSVTSQYPSHINYLRYISSVPDQVNIPFLFRPQARLRRKTYYFIYVYHIDWNVEMKV
jgi:hypothetical protein